MPSILVVEDNLSMREGLEITIEKMGLAVSSACDSQGALELLGDRRFDLMITDYKLPGMNGLELFMQARSLNPEIDVIIITAFGSVSLAVEAMQLGAADFLTKPFSPDELRVKLEKVLSARSSQAERRRLAEENELLKNEVAEARGLGEIVGESPSMKEVYNKIDKVAPRDASVLITGESGTGKELVAREIHSKSLRRNKPFIRLSCAALAEGVLESELFGHEKGAFTGSVKARKGRFELADGGTLFLDEIGDISQSVQVKLLRVLQEREFERVGGEKTIRVDVRLISATNKDLKEEVAGGKFREDLFYRIHIVPIELPPLRARPRDIEILARCLVDKICRRMNRPPHTIDPEALELLSGYSWPGNVRELENVLERALVLGTRGTITAEDLPALVETDLSIDIPSSGPIDLNSTMEKIERRIIRQSLVKSDGNKSKTARMLGIKQNTLHYKIEKYNLG
ncbi:MAG: sigma-54 dependent transcriptional regulator [Gemmatimonadota bacterium]|nr:sigma-54 dependent transcriptional regulator [Gemmatimonadota bacterium]